MFNKEIANKVLEKIFTSTHFSNSGFDQESLRYLVFKSLEGEVPKETTIAMDLFKKDASFDPASDSVVRTHIYTLRKKLKNYYLTEGRSDEIRLVIPKGRYEAVLTTNNTIEREGKAKRHASPKTRLIQNIAIAALLILVIYLFFEKQKSDHQIQSNIIIKKDNPIWADFVSSDLPTLIVFGDYFAFGSFDEAFNSYRIREGTINSEADLQKFLQQHPEKRDEVSDVRSGYVEGLVPSVLRDILPFLQFYSENEVKFEKASLLTEKQLEDYNIIFIGPSKTLGILDRYFEFTNYIFKLYPHRIVRQNDSSVFKRLRLEIPIEEEIYFRDFSHVVKFEGKNNNKFLIITAFRPPSIIKVGHKITSEEFISQIKTDYIEDGTEFPSSFECLLSSKEIDGEIYLEIMDFIELGDKNALWDSVMYRQQLLPKIEAEQ